jgi:hypothetical protein
MGSINCNECGSIFTFDILPRRGAVCFKCHVGSIRLGFAHGKEDFHGPTIKERQDQQVAQAKAAGVNAEPVGTRWV